MRHRLPSRVLSTALSGLVALGLLTGADTPKPVTQWVARPSEAARIARVEQGLPALTLPGEAPRKMSLQDWMALYAIPGVSVAVFDKGALVWSKGYGVKHAGGNEPVTIDTLFQAASISKPVTALAAMHHAEKRKWSLDENINDKLVSWKVPDNEFTQDQKVTLRRLLSHSAGTTVGGFRGYSPQAPLPTLPQVLNGESPANTAPVRVNVVPGTLTRYSGGGTLIVQQMLIDQLQKPFPQIMRETVLAPLGMKHSTFEHPLPKHLEPLAASGTRSGGKTVEGRWAVHPELAAAGLWTTPTDLTRIGLEVSPVSKGPSQRVVSKAMAQQMLTRQSESFGIGFLRRKDLPWFGHAGGNQGYRCLLIAFPETGSGIAIMTNSDDGMFLFDRLVSSAAAEYGWKGFTADPESASFTTDMLLRMKGADAAIAWFTAHKNTATGKDAPSAAVLNDLAYGLMGKGQLPDALKLFETNVALYPEDANAHDSLGEGYAAAGRKGDAIRSYKKSLELNPQNDNAVKQLKDLGAGAAAK
ncbi:beta-lactamase [Myxococcus stipitatus DSM 14675]|uniref:Beta-lactamase n=1 Tax=Myxococcus stipitatus (strain DSM 14675 / JCM 12634 / Mx s8) TaxID=1278073 RepID=L7UK31_MYXSD|nr:serine hydrolase domain-containing protein [Myxococcus stipitatus]AGC49356.1 beta-lactamase [Myxococcus stipitatus DSM 14675]